MARVIRDELGIDVNEIMYDLRELTIHYIMSRHPNATNALPSDLYTKNGAGGFRSSKAKSAVRAQRKP